MENKEEVSRFSLTKTHVKDIEFSEIDMDLNEEFDIEDADSVMIHIGSGDIWGRYPIKIDKMIEALNEMKSSGITHIEIGYHSDHPGYTIAGYEIRTATPEEINREEMRIADSDAKYKEFLIEQFRRQLAILESE